MDPLELGEALRIARAAQRMGRLSSGDWSDLAVAFLIEAVEDPEVAELAAFDRRVSPWKVDPLIESLYERYGVAAPTER